MNQNDALVFVTLLTAAFVAYWWVRMPENLLSVVAKKDFLVCVEHSYYTDRRSVTKRF